MDRCIEILYREIGRRQKGGRKKKYRDNAQRTDENALRTYKYSWQSRRCKEVVMHPYIRNKLFTYQVFEVMVWIS